MYIRVWMTRSTRTMYMYMSICMNMHIHNHVYVHVDILVCRCTCSWVVSCTIRVHYEPNYTSTRVRHEPQTARYTSTQCVVSYTTRVPHEYDLSCGVWRVAAVRTRHKHQRSATAVVSVDVDGMIQLHKAGNGPLGAGLAAGTTERRCQINSRHQRYKQWTIQVDRTL